MKKSLLAVVLLALLSACGGSGGNNAPATNNPPVTGPTPAEQLSTDLQGLTLDDYYLTSFEALTRRSPEAIVWGSLQGIYPTTEARLDDISDRYSRDTFAMVQVALDALR